MEVLVKSSVRDLERRLGSLSPDGLQVLGRREQKRSVISEVNTERVEVV